MWVQLIEKAYAKMLGSYKNTVDGEFSDHFLALTGRKTLKLQLDKNDSQVILFSRLEKSVKDGNLITFRMGRKTKNDNS